MSEITIHPARAAAAKSTSKKSAKGPTSRPNYNHIHRNLLPIETCPLPVLIPHNPLSVIAVALTYLAHVVKPVQRTVYNGYFSSATSSIHITDEKTQRALWEMGFFGRGNLSRSEPTWLENQRKAGITAEENTERRRTERRQFKMERAKVEQQEIVAQMSKEVLSKDLQSSSQDDSPLPGPEQQSTNNSVPSSIANPTGSPPVLPPGTIQGFDEWKKNLQVTGLPTPPPTSTCSDSSQPENDGKKSQRKKSVRFSPTTEAREFDLSSPVTVPIKAPGRHPDEVVTLEPKIPAIIENKEHLQLSMEEAFFLNYSLGVFNVLSEDDAQPYTTNSALALFCQHSCSPRKALSTSVQPDDPFLMSYAVYHHYRSQGWVVRSGVKFGTDYLLYNRGPAFSHAEFAIIVLPSYTDSHWSGPLKQQKLTKTQKSWWWLHGINRVQNQVLKSLVLCYVDIPGQPAIDEAGNDIGKLLSLYKVRDINVKRWSANRNRD